MQASVQEGTSGTSKVQGYSSGGKTGTAEKFPRGNGKYLVSFITFAPVDDPQILLYVVVDEPKADEQADSKYPQYIAQGILSELLPYLNVTPDESEDGSVPETELWEGFKGHLVDVSGSSVDEKGNLVVVAATDKYGDASFLVNTEAPGYVYDYEAGKIRKNENGFADRSPPHW